MLNNISVEDLSQLNFVVERWIDDYFPITKDSAMKRRTTDFVLRYCNSDWFLEVEEAVPAYSCGLDQ